MLLATAVLTLSMANTHAATTVTSNVFARFGSGNSILAEDGVSGFILPDDGSTGLQQVQNTHLDVVGEGTASLANNAIGVASGWLGASVIDHPPNGGTIWFLASGAFVRYDDMLTVSSSTLPIGTPVQIQFSLQVASSMSVDHSVLPGNNNNNSFSQGFVDTAVINTFGPDFFLNENANHAIVDTTTSIADFQLGLMNPATPHLDFTINALVGDSLRFLAEATVRTNGNLAPITVSLNPITLDNTTGAATASIGLAFGATSLTPGVTLLSEHLGDEFPAAALADAAHAALGMPVVPIPVPGVAPLLTVALAVLARVRRHRG
jgi:hypothetical protein